MSTRLWCVKNVDIFSNLKDEKYHLADKISSTKRVKRGDVLYIQGSADKNVYLIEEGVIKLNKLTPQGRVIIIDILKSGTFFGEIGAIEDSERDETAEAMEDGLICVMSKKNFDTLLSTIPGLSIELSKIIALRRWKVENKLLDLLYSTVEARLAKSFLNLLVDFGVPDGGSYILKLKLTHQNLAELIASTRETTTMTINNLKKRGIIDYKGKYIRILNKQRLYDISQESIPA